MVVVTMLAQEAIKRLREGCRVDERAFGAHLSTAQLASADAIVTNPYDQVDDAVLARAPHLRIVAQFGVGTDNIDLDAAHKRSIVVSHTPGAVTDATADLTLALLLSVSRRLSEAQLALKIGPHAMPMGMQLRGKTIGIIGMGRIGRAVARRAIGFGMKVCFTTRSRRNPTIERETSGYHTDLSTVLANSDVVSLHCDLNPDSHHLIDEAALLTMKPGALLINTARAQVVDEAALQAVLASGHLGGAGLDVFRFPLATALRNHPRVVATPHAGTATMEARLAMSHMVVDSILAALDGASNVPYRKV